MAGTDTPFFLKFVIHSFLITAYGLSRQWGLLMWHGSLPAGSTVAEFWLMCGFLALEPGDALVFILFCFLMVLLCGTCRSLDLFGSYCSAGGRRFVHAHDGYGVSKLRRSFVFSHFSFIFFVTPMMRYL